MMMIVFFHIYQFGYVGSLRLWDPGSFNYFEGYCSKRLRVRVWVHVLFKPMWNIHDVQRNYIYLNLFSLWTRYITPYPESLETNNNKRQNNFSIYKSIKTRAVGTHISETLTLKEWLLAIYDRNKFSSYLYIPFVFSFL